MSPQVTQQDVVAESRLQSCSTEECRMPVKSEKGNSETKHVICSNWKLIIMIFICEFDLSRPEINISLEYFPPQTKWFIQVEQGKFNS